MAKLSSECADFVLLGLLCSHMHMHALLGRPDQQQDLVSQRPMIWLSDLRFLLCILCLC